MLTPQSIPLQIGLEIALFTEIILSVLFSSKSCYNVPFLLSHCYTYTQTYVYKYVYIGWFIK